MIIAEVDGGAILGILILIAAIMVGPPLILLIIGIGKRKTKPQLAKKLFIAAAVYFIIGLGICATIING